MKRIYTCSGEHRQMNSLTSSDPLVQAFYNQLTERERIAHTIAVEKLGTSYDVVRTHGFLKWKKSQEV
jgi:hypothetical protein